MSLASGARVGPYEIRQLIGEGGMGEVYQAHDAKLNRDVALKILPAALATDQDRLSRFRREAQVLASLNHPNIAAIYGFEDASGVYALALELVEGPTLADRIARGPMPLDEAIAIARQIAEALDAAHEHGFVHRDLKPANIKLRADGVVKVLDFGLAKALENGPAAVDRPHSPTITAPAMTRPGTVLGTAAYMSPEQAQGKVVDKRADIWAFGVVLYEMLSGRRLFAGETLSDTLASVLRDEPAWDRVPAQLHPLLRRCLEKDPKRRIRDIADAMLLFDPSIASSKAARPAWLAWSVAALLLVGLASLSFVHFRETTLTPAPVESLRFQFQLPENLSFPNNSSGSAISPDGRRLAFFAQGPDAVARLWIRDLDSLDVRLLPGTEARLAQTLFWSPDSRFIAFDAGETLKKVQIAGGLPQTICDLTGIGSAAWGGSWSRDDVILLGGVKGLRRVSANGGVPEWITAVDDSRQEAAHAFPSFLPDGKRFIYLRSFDTPSDTGAYLGSLDAKPAEQSVQQLVATQLSPAYVASADSSRGHLLFMRNATLFAQAFDPGRLELSGEPVIVAEQVGIRLGNYGRFSASNNGRLVYLSSRQDLQLTWFDRTGKVLGTVGQPRRYTSLSLSPNGTRAIVGLLDPRTATDDLWVLDLVGDELTRLTFDPAREVRPLWSPDGTRIAYVSTGGATPGVYLMTLNEAGRPELIHPTQSGPFPVLSHWSPDGRFLIYSSGADSRRADDLWVLPLEGEGRPWLFSGEPSREILGRFSPDTRWVAYQDGVAGDVGIHVRPFSSSPAGSSALRSSMISSKVLLRTLRWRGDGTELYYIGMDGKVMAVDVTTSGPAFHGGTPSLLFTVPVNSLAVGPGFEDITADGQRFLFARRVNTREELTVVLNWAEDPGRP